MRFDHVTERVSARLHSQEEADLLAVPQGEPVLSVLVVACDVAGQALQVTDVLLPADRQELEGTYRFGWVGSVSKIVDVSGPQLVGR
ncbi:UTRA domain-containing protein [Streptomyces sp. NPDC048415]|uniref:UTRA domain-containing protein n=1 Tax=Streptomyces sp. NPDC048415 TaxID=3154822 RepID=UPI0034127C5A